MLNRYYEEALSKGWIKGSYEEWKVEVIKRINRLYRTEYNDLTDEEIENYLLRSKFYKEEINAE